MYFTWPLPVTLLKVSYINSFIHFALTGTSEDVLYFAYPVMFGWGIFSGLLNIVILVRQTRASNDCYLIGLTIAR